MAYTYRYFIPQNIAPVGARRIVVYDGSEKQVCTIPLGRLSPPAEEPLYRVGLFSDIHLYKRGEAWVTWNPDGKFDNALTFCESMGCAFVAHSGDFSQTGLYDEGDTETLVPDQFAVYKGICDAHDIPVYGCCGNHESYVVPIINNLEELEEYTGNGLYFTVEQGEDVYICIGQPRNVTPMSDEALQWLAETLEANRNRRSFIFVHPHISSGNPAGAYKKNPLFQNWAHYDAFVALMAHYKNTVIFHGHTHVKFECQEVDTLSTYATQDGFRSVHIPSLGTPRDVADRELVNRDAESQGYIVDVHADFIVLRGWDFIGNKPVPIGTYRIDTTLVEIEAGTFTDPTGTITV